MPRPNPFQMVRAARPGRSVFNLSYEKKFTADMGMLIPVLCEEVVPGDHFKIGNQMVIRFQPLVAPILHEINAFVHYFFVPYRILDPNWEDFISGGKDGDYAGTLPKLTAAAYPALNRAKGSLWDYLGFPVGVDPVGFEPITYPYDAYYKIYNEYYRDENLQAELVFSTGGIQLRNWEKDYFTSALPWQQRGIAPGLPISGILNAEFDFSQTSGAGFGGLIMAGSTDRISGTQTLGTPPITVIRGPGTANVTDVDIKLDITDPNLATYLTNNNTLDLGNAITFNVSDLRQAFAVQRFMERNARGGIRYVEFLQSHFGVNPRDDRLQRPEYIGGSRTPIIISEVLQTSSTDATSPQGNLAGHGIVVDSQFCGSYFATEYGLIMGIMSVMPKAAYASQGVPRQWSGKETRYDFYFPEFANLSEQPVFRGEIYANNVAADNKTIFGYQGRYDELRVKQNMVCGELRDTFDYWHLARKFGAAPLLNSTFIQCNGSAPDLKRIFAVPSEPGMIVQFLNIVRAVRPLPVQSNPGLIDHN